MCVFQRVIGGQHIIVWCVCVFQRVIGGQHIIVCVCVGFIVFLIIILFYCYFSISDSGTLLQIVSKCSMVGATKPVVCTILSVEWCI